MNLEPTKMTHQKSPLHPGDNEQAQSQVTGETCKAAADNDDQKPLDYVILHHDETGIISGIETSCECDTNRHNGRDSGDKELGSSSEGQSVSSSSAPGLLVEENAKEAMRVEESSTLAEEDHGRERLKRHRIEVAGRVWIPDIWGQEELLKDWIDCSAFDASLVPIGIMSARAALVEEGRRANSGGFRIENRQCNDESGKIILVTKSEL